ncbi:MAG: hypothetical protein ACFE8B_06340 [Candidatus Hermodarchaeota archaeon]
MTEMSIGKLYMQWDNLPTFSDLCLKEKWKILNNNDSNIAITESLEIVFQFQECLSMFEIFHFFRGKN